MASLKKKLTSAEHRLAFAASQKEPPLERIAEAINRLGPETVFIPISKIDGSVLGNNGIYAATSDKAVFNRWPDNYPASQYAVVPSLSKLMAMYFPQSLLDKPGYQFTKAVLLSPSVSIEYRWYDDESTESHGSAAGRVFFIRVDDAHSITPSTYAGGFIDGVPNSGAKILDGNLPIAVGGSMYGKQLASGRNVLVRVTWL